MGLSAVLIDYDLATKEIRRIIVPEHDNQAENHPPQSARGWGRTTMAIGHLQVDPRTGNAPDRSSLANAAAAVQTATGVWPPNISR